MIEIGWQGYGAEFRACWSGPKNQGLRSLAILGSFFPHPRAVGGNGSEHHPRGVI